MSAAINMVCINCGRSEDEIPLTAWRMAGRQFWICPDCLPALIHRRSEVMPKWNLTGDAGSTEPGAPMQNTQKPAG